MEYVLVSSKKGTEQFLEKRYSRFISALYGAIEEWTGLNTAQRKNHEIYINKYMTSAKDDKLDYYDEQIKVFPIKGFEMMPDMDVKLLTKYLIQVIGGTSPAGAWNIDVDFGSLTTDLICNEIVKHLYFDSTTKDVKEYLDLLSDMGIINDDDIKMFVDWTEAIEGPIHIFNQSLLGAKSVAKMIENEKHTLNFEQKNNMEL